MFSFHDGLKLKEVTILKIDKGTTKYNNERKIKKRKNEMTNIKTKKSVVIFTGREKKN